MDDSEFLICKREINEFGNSEKVRRTCQRCVIRSSPIGNIFLSDTY